MSAEENKTLVRHTYEALNKGNLAYIDECFVTDVVAHAPGGQEAHGLEEGKQLFIKMWRAFPDHYEMVDDMIAEGDKVVARVRWTGTHKGEFQGIAPTGRQVTLKAITIYRIVGGRIAEVWEEADVLGMMQQLGVIPSP
jgi:steroid delta-isomerase-like uncharacterized protein